MTGTAVMLKGANGFVCEAARPVTKDVKRSLNRSNLVPQRDRRKIRNFKGECRALKRKSMSDKEFM